ncbi:hypothetical protein EII29_00305 [Leptotrichia sp. OH3620_COT-345]|uniref:hypothetical protein n=1 Tax=Leptotrichia sp. OH3620_COT-345 TaxID=2491048 RepID=UPI000F648714|nr:hypothetical protein [Leptotrichia sp. OH3620_COT-345]RRD40928.1 hypothetical protein EII29_00305 [Leptotrichia sp. OH3620_COT-345]
MKKIITLLMTVITINSFSAQVLNNKITSFLTNKEIKNLIFGQYNLDVEIASVSKIKGTGEEATTKAESDAKAGVQTGARDYAYEVLNNYLSGALVSGPGFNSSKMREFANEIAKEVSASAQRRGSWKTSKNETVTLYTIDKQTIKSAAGRVFNERLGAVIQKLTEYRNNFEQAQGATGVTVETVE